MGVQEIRLRRIECGLIGNLWRNRPMEVRIGAGKDIGKKNFEEELQGQEISRVEKESKGDRCDS